MIDLVKKFFGNGGRDVPSLTEDEKTRKIHVAACALFLEMAHIDGEFSDVEREYIVSALKSDFQLSDDDATELMDATKKELEKSIDLWQFTNRINEHFSIEDKIRILETIWKVAYADGALERHEDYLVHKMAELLRLSHKQLIRAKLKVLKKGLGRKA
jgi:uncharacterized tellurite resistance protein B-like protein